MAHQLTQDYFAVHASRKTTMCLIVSILLASALLSLDRKGQAGRSPQGDRPFFARRKLTELQKVLTLLRGELPLTRNESLSATECVPPGPDPGGRIGSDNVNQ